jgi:hypothetical protein
MASSTLAFGGRGDPVTLLADIAFGDPETLRQVFEPVRHELLLIDHCGDYGPRRQNAL